MQRERLFLKNTPIITESEVEQARIEPERRECLHITLNTQGGKTMKAATSAMNLGRDRLALVVQGKSSRPPWCRPSYPVLLKSPDWTEK